ncbi:hypothetical protein HPP92_020064 [Vanilla planifolia]|uniref:Uncharacterized protein n=1 Tax=Vanilla planifolia TaxID=51239 RepID=A0A835Q4D8_VANPL|nr:hypothetical protein HPP92_020064 [Vanilla planifolia]
MRGSVLVLLVFVGLLSQSEVQSFPSGGHLFPTGAIVKHLKSFSPVLKWTKTSAKETETDADAPQFENGYFVETLVDGNKLGIMPYTIRVSPEGELFAVDSENNNVVKITPPLSQYSRARLVAGSFQGYSGHVDGKPSDARFRHPKGVAMDEKGNVYVADTANLAIRKIGESGVTTIAGGKSIVAGYRDGPSEDAKFSNDFDLLYVASTCSLLVVDRGNAALRQISLHQEDCDHHYTSISTSDMEKERLEDVERDYRDHAYLNLDVSSRFLSLEETGSQRGADRSPVTEGSDGSRTPSQRWLSVGFQFVNSFQIVFRSQMPELLPVTLY